MKYIDPSGYNTKFTKDYPYPDPWSAYIQAMVAGYNEGYNDIIIWYEIYYDAYYNNLFSGGGGFAGNGGSLAITWETKYTFTNGSTEVIRDNEGNIIEIRLPEYGIEYSRRSVTIKFDGNSSINDPSNGGGDWYQYVIDGADSIIGAAGTYYGFKGNATHNELYWQGKNGKFYSTSKLTKPGGYARSYKVVNNSLKTAKGLSNSMAGISLLVTGVDIAYNQQVNASHAVNAFMAGISFIGVGSLVAGAYFLTDLGFEIFTGTSLGERIDNAVGCSLFEW